MKRSILVAGVFTFLMVSLMTQLVYGEGKYTADSQDRKESVYETDFLKVNIPAGWKAEAIPYQFGPKPAHDELRESDQAIVKITKGKYIININTRACGWAAPMRPPSPGLFIFIDNTNSLLAVYRVAPKVLWESFNDTKYRVTKSEQKITANGTSWQRKDLYFSRDDDSNQADHGKITNGKAVWFCSYLGDGINEVEYDLHKYMTFTGWSITMSYDSVDIDSLPAKGSTELDHTLSQMTDIIKTVTIFPPNDHDKKYEPKKYSYRFNPAERTSGQGSPNMSGSVYETKFFKINIFEGWKARGIKTNWTVGVSRPKTDIPDDKTRESDQACVEITNSNYILSVDTRASDSRERAPVSYDDRYTRLVYDYGYPGNIPSFNAVIIDKTWKYYGTTNTKTVIVNGSPMMQMDYYVSPSDSDLHYEYYRKPVNGKTVWFFSHVGTGSCFGVGWAGVNYILSGVGWFVTMSYNSSDIDTLPVKGSVELDKALEQMSGMVNTLEIYGPVNRDKEYIKP